MSAQECPTCGAKPGMRCMSTDGKVMSDTPLRKPYIYNPKRYHVSRLTLEYGDWTRIYDAKWRDKSLKFCCRPYAA